MASNYNLQEFQGSRPSLQRLALVLIALCASVTVPSAAMDQIRGELNGNVTFNCPVSKDKMARFVYVQRGTRFLNGYHISRDIKKEWQNTIMNRETSTMVMYSLNISHIGIYSCHIWYTDNSQEQHEIQLSVTANYSKPSVMRHCTDDNQSCLVTCHSHGGYPSDKMKWEVSNTRNTSSQMWKVMNESKVTTPSTMTFNISSTAFFNCSEGQMFFTCSIGDFMSDMQSICAPPPPPPAEDFPWTILAICVVTGFIVILVAIVAVPLYKNYQKGQAGRSGCAERDKGGQSDNEELHELAPIGHRRMEAP